MHEALFLLLRCCQAHVRQGRTRATINIVLPHLRPKKENIGITLYLNMTVQEQRTCASFIDERDARVQEGNDRSITRDVASGHRLAEILSIFLNLGPLEVIALHFDSNISL